MLNPHDRSVGTSGFRRVFWGAFVLALAALSGCGGTPISPEQRAAMSRIQDLGGRFNIGPGGGLEIDLTKTAVDDKDLAILKDIANVRGINLQGTAITDAGLERLGEIPNVKFISLQRCTVTRAGVAKLKKTLPNTEVQY